MARRLIAAILVASFVPAVSAQTLRDSAHRAARDLAAQQQSRGRIPPALFWTGISLLGVGAAVLIEGVSTDEDAQSCITGDGEELCVSTRKELIAVGAAMAGVGVTLLAIGVNRRSHAGPAVRLRRGGFLVQQKVALPRWSRK